MTAVTRRGLFVGATTLDLFCLVEAVPEPNEKAVALDQLCLAGGPATNAAVAFAWTGGQARLISGVGAHPLAALVREDLARSGIAHGDLWSGTEPPDVAVVLVTRGTGSRAVVSRPASRGPAPGLAIDAESAGGLLLATDVVVLDGYHLETAIAVARPAAERGLPVILDGGSWKAGLDVLLPYVSHAVCGERFRPPRCSTVDQALDYLAAAGVAHRAVTDGPRPIRYQTQSAEGELEVPLLRPVVDTTGAGDILHGALAAYLLEEDDFVRALGRAATVASRSCSTFGTRAWMGAPGA